LARSDECWQRLAAEWTRSLVRAHMSRASGTWNQRAAHGGDVTVTRGA
jgi:hypothetical protein